MYRTHSARDRIMDFESGAVLIDLHAWQAVDSFEKVESHASERGNDLWIRAGSDLLVIKNYGLDDLDPGDFRF